jgi:hypothetical protein
MGINARPHESVHINAITPYVLCEIGYHGCGGNDTDSSRSLFTRIGRFGWAATRQNKQGGNNPTKEDTSIHGISNTRERT